MCNKGPFIKRNQSQLFIWVCRIYKKCVDKIHKYPVLLKMYVENLKIF